MHVEMFFLAIFTLFVCQLCLMLWKKYYFRTYQTVTLFIMWLGPCLFSVRLLYFRFLAIWFLFSFATGLMFYLASKKRISTSTPRWFLFVHTVSHGLGLIGYIMIMLAFFQINVLFLLSTKNIMDMGLLALFYGLYYGVVGRDFAEVCTNKMAAQISYVDLNGLPLKRLDSSICSICTKDLITNNEEKIYRLNCRHTFHDFCIRGWCIVGKKDTCPYCKEKVNLKQIFTNPWDKPHIFYGNLLDWVRYLIVWQPLILLIVQVFNYLLGLQ